MKNFLLFGQYTSCRRIHNCVFFCNSYIVQKGGNSLPFSTEHTDEFLLYKTEHRSGKGSLRSGPRSAQRSGRWSEQRSGHGSVRSGQWPGESLFSLANGGQSLFNLANRGQSLFGLANGGQSLFGLAIPIFGYGRSGQCLSWVWSVWSMPVLGRGLHSGNKSKSNVNIKEVRQNLRSNHQAPVEVSL